MHERFTLAEYFRRVDLELVVLIELLREELAKLGVGAELHVLCLAWLY